jgi:hypothetical protein
VSSADVARAEGALFIAKPGGTAPGIGCVPETISAESAIHFRQPVGSDAFSALISKAI